MDVRFRFCISMPPRPSPQAAGRKPQSKSKPAPKPTQNPRPQSQPPSQPKATESLNVDVPPPPSLTTQTSSSSYRDHNTPRETKSEQQEKSLFKEPVPIQVRNWSCIMLLLFTIFTILFFCLSLSAGGVTQGQQTEPGNDTTEHPLTLLCAGEDATHPATIISLSVNPIGCFVHWLGCISFTKAVDLGRHRDPDYRLRHIRQYIYTMVAPLAAVVIEFCIKVGTCYNSPVFWVFTFSKVVGMSLLLYWGFRLAMSYKHWLRNPDWNDLHRRHQEDGMWRLRVEDTSPPSTISMRSSARSIDSIKTTSTTGTGYDDDEPSDIISLVSYRSRN